MRRLGEKRAARAEEAAAVAEGVDLVTAALDAGWPIEALYVESGADTHLLERARDERIAVLTCDTGVLERALTAQSPQPLAAIVTIPAGTIDDLTPAGLVVVLDSLRDPGNVGTVVRTAAAFGASAVVLCGSSVDPFNPKALRATAGAIFRIPVVTATEVAEVRRWFNGHGPLVGTVVRGGAAPATALQRDNVAVVLGSESHGLSTTTVELCDEVVTIPTLDSVESLNVSVAAGVLLSQWFGRARTGDDGATA